MKRLTLVTWLGSGNFGTSLQSFALYHILQRQKYTVVLSYEFSKNITLKSAIRYMLFLLGIRNISLKDIFKLGCLSLQEKKIQNFICKNYEYIKAIYFRNQMNWLIKNTDVFIAGSDQIWNTRHNFNPFYFLDFVGSCKRISYASSIGINDFPEEHKKEVKRLLLKFDHIGVREKSAVDSISHLLGRNDILQVLDPTFLLNDKEWSFICADAEIEFEIPEQYILCYFVGNNPWYNKQLDVVSQTIGIKNVIIIPALENKKFVHEGAFIYADAGPLEFVKLIMKATWVCTDSFHATALSINFNRNFVEFMRFSDCNISSQNSRIYDLLEHYNLRSHIYNDQNLEWGKQIMYESVNKQLVSDREVSLNYLFKAIEN